MQTFSCARRRVYLRPRARRCLLKGCEQRFHPRQPCQRYCSEGCREEARKWSRWKAQQRYRETAAGKQKRNDQSRRYRERIKSRKPPEPESDNEPARVITSGDSFRSFLQSAWLLRRIHPPAEKSFAALLLTGLPAGYGARPPTGAPLETGADLKPEILIHPAGGPYIHPVDATGISPARPSLGAPAGAPSGTAAAIVGVAGGERPADAHRGGRARWAARPVRCDRRLQAHHGASASWPRQSGSGGVANERG